MKKGVLFYFIFFCLSIFAGANIPQSNSASPSSNRETAVSALLPGLKNAKTDTTRVRLLIDISGLLRKNNTDSAILLCSGGSPAYSYSWTPAPGTGQGTSTAGGLSGNTYTCVVTDSLGCSISRNFTITSPPPLITSLSEIPSNCHMPDGIATASVSGGTGHYTYSWSPAGGTGSSTVPLPSGLYTCLVKDSAGCVLSDTISVGNTGSAPAASISSSRPTTFCAGDSTVLIASGGGSYSWSTGSTNSYITVKSPGTYTVVVTNSCGSASATSIIVVNPQPAPLVTGGGTYCKGDSVLLTASGGSTYSWNTGSTGSSIYAASSGNYTVSVSNSCGTASVTALVNISTVFAGFISDSVTGFAPLTVIFLNLSSSNVITWNWNFGDGTSSSSGTNPTHVFMNPGTYTVVLTVINSNGCVSTFSSTIVVKELPSWVLVPNVFTPNGDGVNDLFLAKSIGLKSLSMEIYDRWGVKLSVLNAPDEGWDGRLPSGTAATDGTYYFILEAQGRDGKKYAFNGFFMLLH